MHYLTSIRGQDIASAANAIATGQNDAAAAKAATKAATVALNGDGIGGGVNDNDGDKVNPPTRPITPDTDRPWPASIKKG